ncbi:MAG: DNA-binding protein Fis [uncultured Thiotrichaceae bacterium]|uniref:Putative Fis-like DNA-binding protein n=1 Tax=uncultured Thiotrichaceae bacterium TaxID=298394 RepID=A0A6S6S2I6_9GAMM|nr:MAG: DNA-binding protein Fis [uncultured Thiotrichaceae bacterium]
MSQVLPKRIADESALQELVHQLTIDYLEHFHINKQPENVYRKIVDEIENTLFSTTMKFTFGNQSKAAEYLGINRATLRTKLKHHNLM